MSPGLLVIDDVSAGYGGRPVLGDLSLVIGEGERIALIGPNGCGKSSLLKTITGEVPEKSGTVRFREQDITGLETDEIICRGIGYLRQTNNIFPGLSVGENLDLASTDGTGGIARDRNSILRLFPLILKKQKIRAGLLSGGERQALAVAMVLLRPVQLLLLDEPVAGLSQKNASELLSVITKLQRDDGFAFVLVEHRLRLIHPHVSRVVIMVRGRISEDTTETSILGDRKKLEKYYLL